MTSAAGIITVPFDERRQVIQREPQRAADADDGDVAVLDQAA